MHVWIGHVLSNIFSAALYVDVVTFNGMSREFNHGEYCAAFGGVTFHFSLAAGDQGVPPHCSIMIQMTTWSMGTKGELIRESQCELMNGFESTYVKPVGAAT